MKFYKAVVDNVYDYFTGYATVKDELLTERERNKMFRYLKDSVFETVEVSKKKPIGHLAQGSQCERGKL